MKKVAVLLFFILFHLKGSSQIWVIRSLLDTKVKKAFVYKVDGNKRFIDKVYKTNPMNNEVVLTEYSYYQNRIDSSVTLYKFDVNFKLIFEKMTYKYGSLEVETSYPNGDTLTALSRVKQELFVLDSSDQIIGIKKFYSIYRNEIKSTKKKDVIFFYANDTLSSKLVIRYRKKSKVLRARYFEPIKRTMMYKTNVKNKDEVEFSYTKYINPKHSKPCNRGYVKTIKKYSPDKMVQSMESILCFCSESFENYEYEYIKW